MPAEAGAAIAADRPGPWLFPALALVALAGQVGSFLYLPALPQITAEFGTDLAGAQGTVAAFLAGSLVGFALYGPVADAIGRHRALAVTAAIFVAGSALCAVAPGIGALTAARAVQGLGSVAGIVTARAVIRDAWPPAAAARAMSNLSAVNAIAPAASPILGAVLLTAIDWRAGFWVTAGVGLAALVTGLTMLPPARTRPAGSTLSGIGQVLGSGHWWLCQLVLAASHSLFLVMMAGSPFVLMDSLGLGPLAYSLVMAATISGFGLVAAASGGLAGRLGTRRTILLGLGPVLAGAAALAVVVQLSPGPAAVAVPLALMVSAMGLIVPTCHIAMLLPFPERAATAVSLGMMTTTGAGAAAVWIYGRALGGTPPEFGLAILGLSGLIALGALSLPRDGEAP